MRLLLILTTLLFLPQLARAEPRQAAPILSLWLDPAPLPPAADPAAEAKVFEQTLARTVELFLPLNTQSATALHIAAAAFSARKHVLLQVARFDSGLPVIEFVSDAAKPETPAASLPHRDWASAQRGADSGTPVFELFADVDALRREFLGSFASGCAGRVIHALGVPNARTLMLHGRWVTPDKVPLVDPALPLPPSARRLGEYAKLNGPPLIRLDLSWNSRADEPTTIRGMNIAAAHWPAAQLRMDPPAAPFLCLFRANFRTWLGSALKVRAAWIEPESAAAFEQSCAAWLRASRPAIDRIAGAAPSWLIVHPSTRLPELFIAQVPLRAENASPDPIVREIDQLIGKQFGTRIEKVPDGGTRFPAPADWPLSVIGWNPNPLPPLTTVQFRITLRGGASDAAK